MRNIIHENIQLIEASYLHYRRPLYLYVHQHIADKEICKDLVQDVFLRLMSYDRMVCADTIRNLIFTIAHNLLCDYLRHFYLQQELISYIDDKTPVGHNHTEEQIMARDIQLAELDKISRLSEQRRKVYTLSRFKGKDAQEIAQMLHLSIRTVENHLYNSRKEVRAYIRQCI